MAGATHAVFLSYRREETRHIAGRLADRLTGRLGQGQVFMDVDAVEPGADFAAAIVQEVASCKVLIALIGPTWLTSTNRRERRRLDAPDDWVVLEIQAALERGIPVVPVLADGAVMPGRGDLPEGLQGLARRQAARVDHDTFSSDVTVLLDAVDRLLSTPAQKAHEPTVGADAGVVDRPVTTPAEPPERAGSASIQELLDRERRLRKEIEEFEERLQVRASEENIDLATIAYPKVDKCNHPATKNARLACLYNKTRPFKNERIMCIGEHLGELRDPDLLLYVDCVTQRHLEAEGRTKQSIRYQALQLKMIRMVHDELQDRIQKMRAWRR